VQNYIKISQMIAIIQQFILFSRWWPSAILDLWGAFWDNPQIVLGLYHCAIFAAVVLII